MAHLGHNILHQGVIGAMFVFQHGLGKAEKLLLKTPVGEAAPQVHQAADTSFRVCLDIAQGFADGRFQNRPCDVHLFQATHFLPLWFTYAVYGILLGGERDKRAKMSQKVTLLT